MRRWFCWTSVWLCLLACGMLHCTPTQTPGEEPKQAEVRDETPGTEGASELPKQEPTADERSAPVGEVGAEPSRDAGEPAVPEARSEVTVQEPAGEGVREASGDRPVGCVHDTDCPPPTCQGQSPCAQVFYTCQKGTCFSSQSSQKEATCDSMQGVCVPPTCLSHCDCPQGYDCLSGLCKVGIKAKYCCENDLCPQGQPCGTRLGTGGFCTPKGTGEKSCPDYGGYCTDKTLACKADFTSYPQVPCGNTQQHCCLTPPTNTQCKGKNGRCISQGTQCLPNEKVVALACATSSQVCCLGQAPPLTDCQKQGGVCYQLSLACKAGYIDNPTIPCQTSQEKCCVLQGGSQCQKDADCGVPGCQETAKGCVETVPKCNNGTCLRNQSTAPGKCDATKGRCL